MARTLNSICVLDNLISWFYGIGTAYGYNDVSRLTGLSITHDSAPAYDVAWTYGYNPAGQVVAQTQSNNRYNFTTRAAGTTNYTNNALNQATAP